MPGYNLAGRSMAFSICGLVGISHVPVQVLGSPPLDLFNQVQGLDDLDFGCFPTVLVMLGSFLFGFVHQVLEVPDGRLVAVDGPPFLGNAELLCDDLRAVLFDEAVFYLIYVCSYRFKGH